MFSLFDKLPTENLLSFITVVLSNVCKAVFYSGGRMSRINLGRVTYASICQKFSKFLEIISFEK